MWEIAFFALIAGGLPLTIAVVVRSIYPAGTWRRVVVAWLIYTLPSGLWVSMMLPSLNNERGWQSPTTKGVFAGVLIGPAAGAAILLLGQHRAFKQRAMRGFVVIAKPVDPGAPKLRVELQ